MSDNNVIELVVKALDEASGPVQGIVQAFEGLRGKIEEAVGGAVVIEAFKKFIENTVESENATLRLSQAYAHSTQALYTNLDGLKAYAEEQGKASTFSSGAIATMEAVLLRFDRVSGPVFERARQDTIDLASALGTDLPEAAELVGRALESPSIGMRSLSSSGITFTLQQRQAITELERTGKTAQAQQVILKALEDRFKGAGEAAENSLGGALKRLQNAMGDIFKSGTQGADGLAGAINHLADAVNASQPIVAKWLDVVANAANKTLTAGYAAVGRTLSGVKALVTSDDPLALAKTVVSGNNTPSAKDVASAAANEGRKSLEQIETEIKAAGKILQDLQDDQKARLMANLKEIVPTTVTVGKDGKPTHFLEGYFDEDKTKELYRNWEQDTKAAVEQVSEQYEVAKGKLDELFAHGSLGKGKTAIDEYNKRLNDLIDTALEVDKATGNAIDTVNIHFKKLKEPLDQVDRGIWNVITDANGALKQLATQGGLSARSFLDAWLTALRNRLLYQAIDDLSTYLFQALKKAAGSATGGAAGSGSSGWAGLVVGGIDKLFGFASGGQTPSSGLFMAGEDGPEVVATGSAAHVYNRRQLAFAAGGGSQGWGGGGLNYSPQTQIIVQGSADKATLGLMEARLAENNKQQQRELARMMYRSGMGVLQSG